MKKKKDFEDIIKAESFTEAMFLAELDGYNKNELKEIAFKKIKQLRKEGNNE